jgi:hypothetical protein
MSRLDIDYDPYRGGFTVSFQGAIGEKAQRGAMATLFGGGIEARLLENGRVTAIESFWNHGGLPLRGRFTKGL